MSVPPTAPHRCEATRRATADSEAVPVAGARPASPADSRPRRAVPGTARRRPPRPPALTLAVAQVAVAAVLGGLVELALLYSDNPVEPTWVAGLFVVGAWIYVAAGTVAWLRRPGSRVGLLLTGGGFAWLGAGLGNSAVPALDAAGTIVSTLPIAVVMHLLLAFPSGRLRNGYERAITAAGYGVCLVLQAPKYLFAAAGPLAVADRPDLVDGGILVQRLCGLVVVLLIAVVLVQRMRVATPAQRRVLAPLALYGIVAILAIPLGAGVADLLFGGGGMWLPVVQLSVMAGVPVVFVVAATRGGFVRTAGIAELGMTLGIDDGGRPGLAEVLAAALGDDSVELLFRVPGEAHWVNAAGVTAVPPAASEDRGVAEVVLGGRTIGAIVYDATLLSRREEVREAAQVVALALDRERLTVELRASRARLVEAGDAERRRIARDLHDGLQSRLVLLAVQAGVIGGPAVELRDGLEVAIDELRALVHGVMPAELTERGLPAAVEGLADRMPVEVRLEVVGLERRLSPAVESTGFMVISEALVNAVKHARARDISVALVRRANDVLLIEVHDDGIGGAGPGHGTRSIADRVDALGGRLEIESPTGAGTRVTVELPCAS